MLLKAGRVAYSGSKTAVLTNAHLTAVYDAPIALQQIDGYYHAYA
jgi:ABC-type enterochelin transport system ATPase subunit